MVFNEMAVSFFSNFFKEYQIPSEPIKLFFEMILFAVCGVPKIIGSVISYVYFPPEPKSVEGKIVLITGTARGNGRELAMQFHRLGARVACVDKNAEGNDETVRRIRDEGGKAAAFTADITDRTQIADAHAAIRSLMGTVDMLVNNAGLVEPTLFADPAADDTVTDVLNTNLIGPIWIIREILPSMLERNSGHIVTISSLTSLNGKAFYSAYSATKGGLNSMMQSLSKELKLMKSEVITTTVCPYFIANCPDRSARRILRLPEIPTEEACELIIEGILRNERIFTIHDYFFYLLPVFRFLPEDLQDMAEDIIYSNYEPNPHEMKIIAKYTESTEKTKYQASLYAPCMKMGSATD